MKAVIALESHGYSVNLNGERVQVERKTGFSPDAETVKVLLQEIKEKRSKAVRFLKQRRISVWCPYKDLPRWVSWDACLYHRERNDPACQGCRPERRLQIVSKEIDGPLQRVSQLT